MTSVADFTCDAAGAVDRRSREVYSKYGILLVRGLIQQAEIEDFTSALRDVIKARLASLGADADDRGSLDELLNRLIARDQTHAMDVIRAARDLPQFYRFLGQNSIVDVVRNCLGVRHVQAVHDIAQMRIDPPKFHERDFDWHQDYPYNMMSLNAVTLWAPLTPITREMGFLKVIPASHGDIRPVRYDTSRHEPGRGTSHSLFRLADEPAEDAIELDDVHPGDVAFFHGLLVHKSGRNRSDNQSRWVVNTRYGDLLDPAVVSRAWRTVRDKTQGVFLEVHPEKLKERS